MSIESSMIGGMILAKTTALQVGTMHSSLDYKQRSKICGKSVALWRKSGRRCEHSDKKAAPDGAAGRSIFTSAERE